MRIPDLVEIKIDPEKRGSDTLLPIIITCAVDGFTVRGKVVFFTEDIDAISIHTKRLYKPEPKLAYDSNGYLVLVEDFRGTDKEDPVDAIEQILKRLKFKDINVYDYPPNEALSEDSDPAICIAFTYKGIEYRTQFMEYYKRGLEGVSYTFETFELQDIDGEVPILKMVLKLF